MTAQDYKILLEWYRKGGRIVGEEQIHLTYEELADRMGFKELYPPFVGDMYQIKKEYLEIVQPLVNHKIELDKYNYYVCSVCVTA